MKKFICATLAALILMNSLSFDCLGASVDTSDESTYYVDDYYEFVYSSYKAFMEGYSWAEYLSDDNMVCYPQIVEQLEDNEAFQAALSAAETLINAEWSDIFSGSFSVDDVKVQYYVTALSSLLMTMESNWTDIKSVQVAADAEMTWLDYAADAASITAGVLSGAADGVLSSAFSVCGIGIDTLDGAIETLEDYQNLETMASTYLMYHSLLEIIVDNSTDPLLVQAAEYLITATDLCFAYRTEYYSLVVDTEASYFFDVLDKVMEAAEDGELASGEWAALNGLNIAVQAVNQFKLGMDIGEFACNAVINSSDTILRYYEMCAMAEVWEALITEITRRDAEITSQDDYEAISEVSDLLMSLLCVNVRGEYCVYSLLMEDAGLLSVIYTSINGETYENWFDGTLEITNNIIAAVKAFFPDWEDYIVEEASSDNVLSANALFEKLPEEFLFTAGVGNWSTTLFINNDGTFTGQYYDLDMGDTGSEYSGGTEYICNFEGSFTEPIQISDYIYSIEVASLNVENPPGWVYIDDNIKYIASEPYGLSLGDEFLVYLPGCPLSDVEEYFIDWITGLVGTQSEVLSSCYGIYNVNDTGVFFAMLDEESASGLQKTDLIGTWKIDETTTMSVNGVGMTWIFGSSYKYGNEMILDADGSFSYGIAAGHGGEGTWALDEQSVNYHITTYEEDYEETGELIIDADGYLIMQYSEYTIYWVKTSNISENADECDSSNISGEYLIGICQLVQNELLDASSQGFKDALTDNLGDKVVFDYQIADADSELCSEIIEEFISENVDLIMAASTISLRAAAELTSTIPILGTAVTDYCAALSYSEELRIESAEGPTGHNISGTSDANISQTESDYYNLGYATGLMAYDILVNGADISSMPIQFEY